MKVLVIGGGGREHAYVWKIAQSPRVEKVFAVPGNAGIAEIAECRPIPLEKGFEALVAFVQEEGIDLTVVGPEAPLVDGIVDAFEEQGLRIFGPNRSAARLEGSKAFSKDFMAKYEIPTATYRVVTTAEEARAYVREVGAPIVVKASGLAAGKGAIVCETLADAEEAIRRIMIEREFDEAGDQVVIEECLVGEEASFTALCDGEFAVPLATSQDHKRIGDGDTGPNTGGMGAYSPAPVVDDALFRHVMEEIVGPTLAGMAAEGAPYRGILYVGLMVTETGPKVLEYNCRLGDPEAQPILMRLASDLVDHLEAAIDGRLAEEAVEWRPESAVCVVLASGGYPREYRTGFPISGLDEAAAVPDTVVFHAGTKRENGRIVTSGGRVLGVTSLGATIAEAVERAYTACEKIHFENVTYRRDIAHRALARERGAGPTPS